MKPCEKIKDGSGYHWVHRPWIKVWLNPIFRRLFGWVISTHVRMETNGDGHSVPIPVGYRWSRAYTCTDALGKYDAKLGVLRFWFAFMWRVLLFVIVYFTVRAFYS